MAKGNVLSAKHRIRSEPDWRNLWFGAGVIGLICLFAAPAKADPAMWVIRNGDSTTYLVGTLHLLKRQSEWKADKLTKALADSKELWLEVANPEDQSGILPLLQKYGYDKAKPLSSRLDQEQKKKLKEITSQYGLTPEALEPMRPWLAALLLAVLPLQKAGYDASAGIDHLLKEQAIKEHDKVQGFETQEQQVQFLAELPEADQMAFFNDTLDDVSEGIGLFDKLAKAWIDGDTKTIGDVFVDEIKAKAPSIYKKLLVDRNIQWANNVAELVKKPGVRLVAVGAGHLVGPDSLQVQLAKKGIKAEPY